jgi:hypothetical protein
LVGIDLGYGDFRRFADRDGVTIEHLWQLERGVIAVGKAEKITVRLQELPQRVGGKVGGEQADLAGDRGGRKPDREPVSVGACVEHVRSRREFRRDSVDVRQKATYGNRRAFAIGDGITGMPMSD